MQGRIFIDRDPKHFRLILNYLRDGACVLPAEEAEMMELLQEVEFYQVRVTRCSPATASRSASCCPQPLRLLHENPFSRMQLDGLRTLILGEDETQHSSAQHLRNCIGHQIRVRRPGPPALSVTLSPCLGPSTGGVKRFSEPATLDCCRQTRS